MIKVLHERNSGFTLLELLIAITLSALLLTVLSSGLKLMTDDWADKGDWFEGEIDSSLGLLQLERALHAMFPHQINDPENHRSEIYFRGDDDDLRWVSTLSPGHRQQLSAWRLFTQPSSAEGSLVELHLSVIPALSGPLDERLEEATTDSTRILRANKIELNYLVNKQRALQEKREPLEWVDDWPPREQRDGNTAIKRNVLPLGVRILITGSDPRYPERLDRVVAVVGVGEA